MKLRFIPTAAIGVAGLGVGPAGGGVGRGGLAAVLATSALAVALVDTDRATAGAGAAGLAALVADPAALATAPATGIINSMSEPSPIAVSGFLMSAFFWPPTTCMTVVGNTNDAAVPAIV